MSFPVVNEPFTDQLVNSPYAGYDSTLPYTSKYNIYINGGPAYLQSSDNLFSFTGMGQSYNEIRGLGCSNVIIIGAAESFSYMNFNSGEQWSYDYPGNPNPNSILDTYNCFTELKNAIINGTVPVYQGNTILNGNYPSSPFVNTIVNLHPYCGLYSGASKAPGYYNSVYNTNKPGFGQIVAALQNTNFTQFYIDICSNDATKTILMNDNDLSQCLELYKGLFNNPISSYRSYNYQFEHELLLPKEWVTFDDGSSFFNILDLSITNFWFDDEVIKMINEKGAHFFSILPIWDSKWLKELSHLNKNYNDPRNIFKKFLHLYLHTTQRYYPNKIIRFVDALYKRFHRLNFHFIK
jgi:hypothetical protein